VERLTRQRAALQAAIAAAKRPLSVEELLEHARGAVPDMSMATVYRNLKLMTEEGSAHAVSLPGEPPRYEAAGHGHHHHFRCRACNRVFDVHACPGDLSGLAPAGFVVDDHDLTLYGRCADCARR
jgi:Fur family transcriptional regulator, ferric uptake regulator